MRLLSANKVCPSITMVAVSLLRWEQATIFYIYGGTSYSKMGTYLYFCSRWLHDIAVGGNHAVFRATHVPIPEINLQPCYIQSSECSHLSRMHATMLCSGLSMFPSQESICNHTVPKSSHVPFFKLHMQPWHPQCDSCSHPT